MYSVAEFLKKTADKNGFVRERFDEAKITTDFSNLSIMPIFGDLRSTIALSAFLMNRYRELVKGSKYFIVAGWPGFQGLFPYADEYWSFSDQNHLKKFYEASESLKNKSDLVYMYTRNLNEFFKDVCDYKEFLNYYDNGFKNKYFEKFQSIKKYMPFVPSSTVLGKDFNRELSTKPGYKVLIHPSMYAKQWYMGRSINVRPKREFWTELVGNLLANNFTPVVWQNYLSYDISGDYAGKCIFVPEKDIVRVLAAMRSTGCVLDVFNNISRLAILARCPYVAVDERSRYSNQKEYEFDDLLGKNIPKEYIFSFSTIVTDGDPVFWGQDIFPSIIKKLSNFIPELDRNTWPTTSEVSEFISYRENVRKTQVKKLGTRFIKVPRD